MFTERFIRLRRKALSNIFEKKKIADTWKNIVRGKLRKSDIKDIFDYYDFNNSINDRASAIRDEILSGNYRVSNPLIYRVEKKYGICRHMIVPQPVDALIVQTIVDNISEKILSKQPSKNAYYSRDKHNIKHPHDFDDYGLNRLEQWKEMQTQIYNFSNSKAFIVTTDLSNYYDSIDIRELKKYFSSLAPIDEALIDVLFKVVENISWQPDYLPYSHRGLPTSDTEAIRLLAHSFLFEVDEVLSEKTSNCFTRWMDDITLGADSKKEATEIISCISDILKSRGLALNIAKTAIFNHDEGHYNLLIDKNRILDAYDKIEPADETERLSIGKDLMSLLRSHLKDQQPKYWDKVAKRLINNLARIKSILLLNSVDRLYLEIPVLRPSLLYYLKSIGYNNKSARIILNILNSLPIFDDISLSQLSHLVVDWKIPITRLSSIFLDNFERNLTQLTFNRNTDFDYYCLFWFKAKYNDPKKLIEFVTKFQNRWQNSPFLRRQVTAILTRTYTSEKPKTEQLLQVQIDSGISNTVPLANTIIKFSGISKLDNSLKMYLLGDKNFNPTYSISRFLVLCSVLNSTDIATNSSIINRIKSLISDPYYKKWLYVQYEI
ncbi:RNA-directed DNA polymerase [Larkinella rosea]|uniref:RNA-directed DNA polymerase n=1 Tax=Larkinella rosea TaxID=2025312 RepID=A0A3P1BZK3_9BACT|nr:RNA-directed DNA polymerase [Larkinella rosea]RRB06432.1 RNA-directed DNA polymerase [Larkinella rosea]